MAQKLESVPIKINWGHDGSKVVMVFSRAVTENRMTIKEAEDAITALQFSLQALKDYLSEKGIHTAPSSTQ